MRTFVAIVFVVCIIGIFYLQFVSIHPDAVPIFSVLMVSFSLGAVITGLLLFFGFFK